MSGRKRWVKLWVDEMLRKFYKNVSCLETRSVFEGLILLAGDTPGSKGYVKFHENMGLSNNQIASLLYIDDVKIINRSLAKLENKNKTYNNGKQYIAIDKNNIIQILNWSKFQSNYDRQKPYRDEKETDDKVTSQGYIARLQTEVEVEVEREVEVKQKKKKTNKEYVCNPYIENKIKKWNKIPNVPKIRDVSLEVRKVLQKKLEKKLFDFDTVVEKVTGAYTQKWHIENRKITLLWLLDRPKKYEMLLDGFYDPKQQPKADDKIEGVPFG